MSRKRRITIRSSDQSSAEAGNVKETLVAEKRSELLPETVVAAARSSIESVADVLVRWRSLICLVALPSILFVVNPNWPFQGLGHMDPWYYFGYFSHFPQYQRIVPQYSGERLTWILPGFLLARLFGHVYGTLLLHFLAYYVSIFSTYYVVGQLRNERTAFATACLLGCHPLFIGANGWDYVDGASIAYLSLALAFLTAAAFSQRPRAYLVSAGVAWTALVTTYLFWVTFTPICFFYYLCIDRHKGEPAVLLKAYVRRVWSLVLPFMAGVTVTVFALSLCHTLIYGRRQFFLLENLRMAAYLSKVTSNPWIEPGARLADWFPGASWLVFPLLAFVVCSALTIEWLRRENCVDGPTRGAIIMYYYCFGILVAMTFRALRLLETDFYASILIPLLFLVLGLTILEVPSSLSNRAFYLWLFVVCAICLLPLTKPLRYRVMLVYSLLLPYTAGVLGVLVRLVWPRRAVTWVTLVMCLSVASFGLVPKYPGLAWTANYNGLATWTRVSESIDVIRRRIPKWQAPTFWIDDFTHPLSPEYRAIMCAVPSRYSMWHYPKVDERVSLRPDTPVVLITDSRDVFDGANQAMTKAGMPLALYSQDFVSRDGVSYWITVVTVQPLTK